MVFNSLEFILFFIAVYALYRVMPHRGQNWMLLLASYYFYAAWDWRFLSLLLASTGVDYTVSLAIARTEAPRRRRLLLAISVVFNLTLLGFFKYFNFFADSLIGIFNALGWQLDYVTVRVLLPIGISFYTFMTMSYVIDVYRRNFEPTRDLLDFALFVAFFPQLVAGPILRAASLLPQIAAPRRITREQIRDGLWLILWGYLQKVYVADNLAGLANRVFEPDATVTGVNVLLGVYAFALQIYGDFAGYSNIARGTSKLMGIELIENFRFPYFVRSPQDFWRHWHISLSTWLRDYLYIPLGGSRGGSAATYRNLMLTMVLGGLWHGAAWNFVIWGAYQGLVLIAYRLGDRYGAFRAWVSSPGALSRLTSWLVMFHVTCCGWLVFRARSAAQIGDLSTQLVTNFAPASVDVQGLLLPLVMYGAPLAVVHAVEAYYDDVLVVPRLPALVRYSVYVGAIYLTLLFGNFSGAEFIYFQF